jgi:predicted RNase H-like nuclease (RuvC/YqgF family)
MKYLTRSEAEIKRQKAVDFLHRIGNDDLADDFEDMSPEEYAEHKGAELLENPHRRVTMAKRRKTVVELEAEVADLQEQVGDLEEENESLQGQLDQVADIVTGEDEDEEEETEEEEEDGYES